MEENSFIKAFRLSFDVRGGLYVSDRYAFREITTIYNWTIKPSQCSYMFSFNLTSLLLLSTYTFALHFYYMFYLVLYSHNQVRKIVISHHFLISKFPVSKLH